MINSRKRGEESGNIHICSDSNVNNYIYQHHCRRMAGTQDGGIHVGKGKEVIDRFV